MFWFKWLIVADVFVVVSDHISILLSQCRCVYVCVVWWKSIVNRHLDTNE